MTCLSSSATRGAELWTCDQGLYGNEGPESP